MPIYTYRCDRCGLRYEHLSKVSDRDMAFQCDCGSSLQRTPTMSVIRMQGGNPKIDYEHAFNADLYGKEVADGFKRQRSAGEPQ